MESAKGNQQSDQPQLMQSSSEIFSPPIDTSTKQKYDQILCSMSQTFRQIQKRQQQLKEQSDQGVPSGARASSGEQAPLTTNQNQQQEGTTVQQIKLFNPYAARNVDPNRWSAQQYIQKFEKEYKPLADDPAFQQLIRKRYTNRKQFGFEEFNSNHSAFYEELKKVESEIITSSDEKWLLALNFEDVEKRAERVYVDQVMTRSQLLSTPSDGKGMQRVESALSELSLHPEQSVLIKQYDTAQDQGYRNYQEDRFFLVSDILGDGKASLAAVIDGHGGEEVAELFRTKYPDLFKAYYSPDVQDLKRLFQQSFAEFNNQLRQQQIGFEQGACICVLLIRREANGKKRAYVANLGDTRAVLVRADGTAKRLSYDHKADDAQEVERVRNQGGIIFRKRLGGQLLVTRAIGDLELLEYGLSIEPHFEVLDISTETPYIVVATDGLWDVCKDEEVYDFIKNKASTSEQSAALKNLALERSSGDNITTLVIKLVA